MKHQSQLIAVACVAALAFAPLGSRLRARKKADAASSAVPAASASPAAAATKVPRPIPFHGMSVAIIKREDVYHHWEESHARLQSHRQDRDHQRCGCGDDERHCAKRRGERCYWKAADNSLEAKTVKIGAMTSGEKRRRKRRKKKLASPADAPKARQSPRLDDKISMLL